MYKNLGEQKEWNKQNTNRVLRIVGFRWYHIPFGDGDGGWAWAPRSTQGAFGLPFGSSNFTGNEGLARELRRNTNGYEDLELGPVR